jgi:hypothetical protein
MESTASDGQRNEETAPGSTEVGSLTSKSMRAFTKASRACLLYDFDNAAVEDFLKELDFRLEKVLLHGALRLEIRPWQLLRDGEVVYLEHDREKSLAFRLYRDGIRALTFDPEASWEEITQLVGIMSIGYSGIRQQEEDTVTLFRRSNFEHIHVDTVTSYKPIDDELEGEGLENTDPLQKLPGVLLEGIIEFNHSSPEFADHTDVVYRPIPPEQLNRLRTEDGAEAVPGLCLRLVELLMAAMGDAETPLEVPPVVPLLRDIRDFLLGEGFAEELRQMVRVVYRAAEHLANPAEREKVLAVFSGTDAFAAMMDAAVVEGHASSALIEIAAAVPKDRLEDILTVVASRWSGAGCEVGREIVATGLGGRIKELGDVILKTHGPIAEILLEVAADSDFEFATHLALAMLRRDDRSGQLKALEVLERLPYRSQIGRVLTDRPLQSKDTEVCVRSAEVLAAKGERRAAPILKRIIGELSSSTTELDTLQQLMASLARLDPAGAVELVNSWIEPQKLIHKVRAAPGQQWFVAVHALAVVEGKESAELLQWIHARATGELKVRCMEAIARQREPKPNG